MRKFTKRKRSAWDWASSGILVQGGAEVPVPVALEDVLLPAARVRWLCEQAETDHIVCTGILLWMNVTVRNNGSGAQQIPPTELYVIRAQKDRTGDLANSYAPFREPEVPSAIVSWDDDNETDGTDDFMWTHFMGDYDNGGANGDGVSIGTSPPSVNAILNPGGTAQYAKDVSMAWQPSVHIRTKRRLSKTEEIILQWQSFTGGNTTPTLPTTMIVGMQWVARILLQRG